MIKDYGIGERITAFLLLKGLEYKTFDNGSMLSLTLGDRSGNINAVVWENVEQINRELQDAQVVKVHGLIGSYRSRLQLKVEAIRPARDGEYDPEELKRGPALTIEDLRKAFAEITETVDNTFLRALLERFARMPEYFEKYLQSPAGKKFHHDYAGGLAEHCLSLAGLAVKVCTQYDYLDRDLLVTGALLHDVGKILEFEGELVYDYSDAGRLVGHITIGDHLVINIINDIEDFPADLALKLRHLILSHHGKAEMGAAVTPKTREAYVLHFLDEIDSKLNAINKIAEKTDGKWSEYNKLLDTFLFFG